MTNEEVHGMFNIDTGRAHEVGEKYAALRILCGADEQRREIDWTGDYMSDDWSAVTCLKCHTMRVRLRERPYDTCS